VFSEKKSPSSSKVETLDFKPFLPHRSPEMIFSEDAPHTPKNIADKTTAVLSAI